MRKACDGLILRVSDVGEHDRALVLLTADEGKLYITAKGARSVKSKNASICRICAYVNLELYEKNDKYWLAEGSVNKGFFGICEDLDTFSLASYIMQLAEEITGEGTDESEVLRMALNTLYVLENKICSREQVKATFELFAANHSGFVPDLSTCTECDCNDFSGGLWLDVMNGSIICDKCHKKKSGGLPLPETDEFLTRNLLLPLDSSALEAMRYVASAPLQRIFAYGITDMQSLDLLCRASELYLLHHLERDFDTLRFYKSLSKFNK